VSGTSRTVVATGHGRLHDTRGDTDETAPRNEVLLVGRVSGAPVERELPSGDRLVTWRVVVERPAARRPPEGVRAPTVDTFDCVAWTAPLRRKASALLADDVVEVRGALRRRFWRSGAGAASRCEVEAASLRRVARRTPA
jgi:single-strand DNA-binding protein